MPKASGGTLRVLAYVSATLSAVASAIGLLVRDFYHRDPAILAPQLVGQDLVTLTLGVPLLALAAWLGRSASMRSYLCMSGGFLYLAYTYATYAFGARFNALFLVYVAILGLSVAGFVLTLPTILAARATAHARETFPRRTLAGILIAIAVVFVFLWGTDIVPALLSGGAPKAAIESQMPTSMIHVLDLAFILPLCVVAAVLLLRRRDAGIMLSAVLMLKATTLGLAVLSMAAFAARAGQEVNLPVAVSMSVMVVALLAVGWRALRAIDGPVVDGPRPRAALT